MTQHTPALVTLRLRDGLRSLRADAEHAVLEAARLETAHDGFRIVHHSLQSNHVHLIVEATDNAQLAIGMKRFSLRLAKRWNKLWKRTGRVFADRYHLHVLRTPKEVRNALLYVLSNARKHDSWSARRPDVYSSGESFGGWREYRSTWAPARCATTAESRPRLSWSALRRKHGSSAAAWAEFCRVSPEETERQTAMARLAARSWLLREGWRRHGLIELMERPALERSGGRRRTAKPEAA